MSKLRKLNTDTKYNAEHGENHANYDMQSDLIGSDRTMYLARM
jgi:hypothetical protein